MDKITIEPVGYGWLNFTINDFKASGSYLTDIPLDWLETIYFSLDKELPFTLYLDEEGSEVIISAFYGNTIIYATRELVSIQSFSIGYKDLAIKIFKELKRSKNNWIKWLPKSSYDEDYVTKRTEELDSLISKIDKLIEENYK